MGRRLGLQHDPAMMPKDDYVPGDGPRPASIAFVGEAPAREEVKQGRPFVGPSGGILWQLVLRLASLDRSEVYTTNLKKTPFTKEEEKNGLADADFEKCTQELHDELLSVGPDFVLALGRWSSWALTEKRLPMEYLHGLGFQRSWWTVVPAYHPAGAIYSPDQLKYTAADIEAFGRIVRGDESLLWASDQTAKGYYLVSDCLHFSLTDPPARIAIDTEGSVEQPYALSFSVQAGLAGVIAAADAPSIARFRRWLEVGRPEIIFHYAIHDIQILRAMGIDVPALGLRYRDTSLYAFQLPTEPQGLKPLAFRHLGVERESYDELVGRHYNLMMSHYLDGAFGMTLPRTLGYTRTGKPKLEKASQAHRLLRRLRSDLAKGKAPELKKRWDGWKPERRAEIIAAVGAEPPPYDLRVVPQAEMVQYAAADADDTLRLLPILDGLVPKLVPAKIRSALILDQQKQPMFERMTSVGLTVDLDEVRRLSEYLTAEMENELIVIRTLIDDPEFNPRSGDDIAEWAFKECRGGGKLCIEKRTKSKVRTATDKKTLVQYQADHEAIGAILRYKEMAKLMDAYVKPLPGFVRDGKLHPNWRLTTVPTGRAAANNPNVMAFPVRSELGKQVRNTIVAPPGMLLGSWDLSQIELRVLAHETQDPLMLKAFREGRDLHDETQKRFGLARLPAKTFNFLIVYGGGAAKAASELLAQGVVGYDIQACEEIIRDWYRVYQGAAKYKLHVEMEMARTGGTRTAGGRFRPLPAIYLTGNRWPNNLLREEAIRQGVNHKIQGRAVEILTEAQIRLWEATLPVLWDMGLPVEPLLQIHDELIFQFPEDAWDVVDPLVMEQMVMGNGGLDVPVLASSSFGKRWGELKA